MKIIRITLAMVCLLVLIIIFAAGSLIFFLDPNKLKPTIIVEVAKQTGYRLQIKGNLSWSFYPRLGIKIAHLSVELPNQSYPFLELDGVRIATPISTLFNPGNTIIGAIYIAKTRFAKLYLQNTKIRMEWKNNSLTFAPITSLLYGGQLSGMVYANKLSSQPIWNSDIKLNSIQLQSLFQDLNPNSRVKLSGIGKADLKINTFGRNKDQLIRNLNGTVVLGIDKGIFQGIDLNYLVESADALINKQPLTAPPQNNQTVFEHMAGSAIIKNGIASSNDLLISSPAFTTRGSGVINLVDNSLDYHLQVIPLQPAKTKWMVPMLVSGNLQNPSIRLDMLKLNTFIAQEQFEKIKTKIQKEVKQLPGKVDKLLQKLMGE